MNVIDSFSVLAIIPARGGSKGVPRKNLQMLGGRPLIEWTIRAAQASIFIDEVVVTSDDSEIIAHSKHLGAKCLVRPDYLSTDETAASEVILHALSENPGFDVVIYLQPTSPFRTTQHIDDALRALIEKKIRGSIGVVSVTLVDVIPEHMYRQGKDGLLVKLLPKKELRRQDVAETFLLNGAIYCAFKDDLIEVGGQFGRLNLASIVMGVDESIDIDSPGDLDRARQKLIRKEDDDSRSE